ncbi:MAG: translation initiation factor IF-6 [Methanomassiliicoccales archaeon]
MIAFAELGGSNYLGIHGVASDRLAVIPKRTPATTARKIAEVLGVTVIETTVASTSLIGSLTVMNSHGAVISNYATEEEARLLRSQMNVVEIKDKFNAVGNNIVVNDRGAIANPEMTNSALKEIAECLDVEVVKGTVAGIKTVGSACAANNKGALCHPEVTEEEMELLQEVLGVRVMIGTANYGVPLVGACLLANSHGCLAGGTTTPIEMGRMEDALGL